MKNLEFTGVILAATCGARLYPLTTEKDDHADPNMDNTWRSEVGFDKFKDDLDNDLDHDNDNGNGNGDNNDNINDDIHGNDNGHNKPRATYMPKHLLPLAGRPIIHHLLEHCVGVGMERIVIAIGAADDVTKDSLIVQLGCECTNTSTCTSSDPSSSSRSVASASTAESIHNRSGNITSTNASTNASTSNSIPNPNHGTGTTTNNNNNNPGTNTTANKEKETKESESSSSSKETLKNNTKQIRVSYPMNELTYRKTAITIITLPENCSGSAEAMRCIIAADIIEKKSHVMVLPADLVLYGDLASDPGTVVGADGENGMNIYFSANANMNNADGDGMDSQAPDRYRRTVDALGSLADVHRREYRVGIEKGMPLAMSMLLADVGEEDEKGIPLKESAKAKKGGIAREDADIEYIGISTIQNKNRPSTQRIILKQSKFIVEDIENTGATPKLRIPKARLHSPINQIMIKTSWSDLHVFCFSPWALNILAVKKNMKELDKDFVPFLISHQFRGLKTCFRPRKGNADEVMDALVRTMGILKLDLDHEGGGDGGGEANDNDVDGGEHDNEDDYPFLVSGQVLSRESSKLSLRACTLPAYAYVCREVVAQAIAVSRAVDEKELKGGVQKRHLGTLYLPENTVINTKFNTITLPEATIGEKVQVKSSTIGRGVTIGNRCRLNNVVVHDNVIIGENCVLQNSNLSHDTVIGKNCNLNDCQTGLRAEVAAGTKAKGEGF